MGALLIDDSEQAMALARYLALEVRVPLVVMGGAVPPAFKGAPAGAAAVGSQLSEGLRALLVQAVNPARPERSGDR